MSTPPEQSPPERSTLASPKADLRELKANSGATVEELQAFLRELKGKSPQEMLGVVASSHLVRSIVLAAVIVFAGIVVGTALPFAFGEKEGPADSPAALNRDPTPVLPKPAPGPKRTPPPGPDPDPPTTLGVGDTKTAPLNENPLENKGDDFLKDLE